MGLLIGCIVISPSKGVRIDPASARVTGEGADVNAADTYRALVVLSSASV